MFTAILDDPFRRADRALDLSASIAATGTPGFVRAARFLAPVESVTDAWELPGRGGVVYVSGLPAAEQARIARRCSSADFVAVDLSGCRGNRADELAAIRAAGVAFLDDTHARSITGMTQFVGAARRLQDLGARTIVLQHGEYGTSVFAGPLLIRLPAFPLAAPPSAAAGASFAGGFVGALAGGGGRIEPDSLRDAMLCGTVLASFAVEDAATPGGWEPTHEDLADRYGRLVEMVSPGGPGDGHHVRSAGVR